MFSNAKIEEIVASALKIRSDKRSALHSKIKYYRQLGFPALPKEGKGNHTDFSSTASLQLVTVFRLEQHGFLPKEAIRGAITISDAIDGKIKLPVNAYLCFDGENFSIVAAEHAHDLIDRRASATLINITELMLCFHTALEEVSNKPPESDQFLDNVAFHVLEARDGTKF